MNEAFSVESILFKDSFKNTSNDVKVNTSKSMDELVYDAYKSEEDLKFFDTYNMLNEYNTNQKVRMLKRLNNITNNIRNKNITNSCESYIHSLEEDTNKDTNNKEKKKNIFIRFFTWIKEIAIKFAKAVKKAVLKLVEFITKPFKKNKEKDSEADFSNGTDKNTASITKPINEEKWNYLIKIAEKYGMKHTDSNVMILPLEGFDKKNIDAKTSSFTKIVGGLNKIVNGDLDNNSKRESIRNEMTNIKNSQDFKNINNEVSFNSDQEKIQYYFYGGKSTNLIIKKTNFEEKVNELASKFTKYKQELQNICKYTATECEKKAKEIDAICTKVIEFITRHYIDTSNNVNANTAISDDIKKKVSSRHREVYADDTSLLNEIKNITGGLNKVKTEVDKTSILATNYFVDIFKLIRGANI